MKRFNYTILLASLLFASCGNDNENEDKPYDNKDCEVSEIYLSDCLDSGLASYNRKTPVRNNSNKDENDRLTIDISGNYVNINVTDFVWSCDAECIDVNCEVCGDTIKVQATADGGYANCICNFDYSFKIGPLNKGNYKLLIYETSWSTLEENIKIK